MDVKWTYQHQKKVTFIYINFFLLFSIWLYQPNFFVENDSTLKKSTLILRGLHEDQSELGRLTKNDIALNLYAAKIIFFTLCVLLCSCQSTNKSHISDDIAVR